MERPEATRNRYRYRSGGKSQLLPAGGGPGDCGGGRSSAPAPAGGKREHDGGYGEGGAHGTESPSKTGGCPATDAARRRLAYQNSRTNWSSPLVRL